MKIANYKSVIPECFCRESSDSAAPKSLDLRQKHSEMTMFFS